MGTALHLFKHGRRISEGPGDLPFPTHSPGGRGEAALEDRGGDDCLLPEPVPDPIEGVEEPLPAGVLGEEGPRGGPQVLEPGDPHPHQGGLLGEPSEPLDDLHRRMVDPVLIGGGGGKGPLSPAVAHLGVPEEGVYHPAGEPPGPQPAGRLQAEVDQSLTI